MNSPLFQPNSHLAPAFADVLEVGKIERHLDVFRWEDRLVAHEEASGLWWGTLDAREGRDVREFWDECVANERVGRLLSVKRGFASPICNGATLTVGPQLLHVLVAQDNSGLARAQDETRWHPFPPGRVWGIRNTLAARPMIWSRHFHHKFALRVLGALNPVFEKEALERLPKPVRALWPQGASALPLRLIAAALALGWGNALIGRLTPLQFWHTVLKRRSQRHSALPSDQLTFALPDALLQSPEVAFPGEISPHRSYFQANNPAVFSWRGPKVTLRIEFQAMNNSAHEQLEYRLELRDWLSQFFPSSEVESWFAS